MENVTVAREHLQSEIYLSKIKARDFATTQYCVMTKTKTMKNLPH